MLGAAYMRISSDNEDVPMDISSDDEDGGVDLKGKSALGEHAMMPEQLNQSMADSSAMGGEMIQPGEEQRDLAPPTHHNEAATGISQLDNFADMTLEEVLEEGMEDELEEGEIDPRTIPTEPRSSNRASNRVLPLARPQPTSWYLDDTMRQGQSGGPRPLLVILDVNGTLLRRSRPCDIGQPRIGLRDFLQYLFSNHVVLFWSSMKSENMWHIVRAILDDSQWARVAGIWGRHTLRLTPAQYNAKIQVYKQLQWVWADPSIQIRHPKHNTGGRWNQYNTVLSDDSSEKAAAQPYNLVHVPELRLNAQRIWEREMRVLEQVAGYLQGLSCQGNVSWWMRRSPFELQEW